MEVLTINTARSIWLIDTRYLNPMGKNIENELVEWLKTAYDFKKYPSLPINDPAAGAEFTSGTFETGNERYYVDLTIFNDGLVANTRASTRITDQFLQQALISAARQFQLAYENAPIQRKLYVSELEVRLLRPIRFFNPDLERFAAKITEHYPEPISFQFASLGFWADPSIQRWRPSNFVIERKLGSESDNICFSQSPLQTDDHLKLLQEFEDMSTDNAMTVKLEDPNS
jgi:hypothetical protein